jgi:glycosyltransferase involved in cell wall biosynthesis
MKKMRIMLFSSMLYAVHKYAEVFSRIPDNLFIISPLVPSSSKHEYERYMKVFDRVHSPNVSFSPIFLKSSNESFLNLLNPLTLLCDFQSIFKKVNRSKPDAIIGMYLTHAYPLLILKRLLDFRLYTLAVGSDIYGIQTKSYVLANQIIIRNCEKVFAVSYELKDMIEKITKNCNPIVVPTGVDPAFFNPLDLKPNLRSKWGIENDDYIICTLCNLTKRKRVEDIIRAVQILKNKQSKKIKLIIAGDGPDKPSLETLTLQLGIRDNVKFLGFISEQEKLELFNLSDSYVLASLKEGLPFSLLEAMSCECLCVATAVGDVGRVINDKHNGFIIRPNEPNDIANKISSIMSLPTERIMMIKKESRRTILENYDFEIIVKQMLNVIYDTNTRERNKLEQRN